MGRGGWSFEYSSSSKSIEVVGIKKQCWPDHPIVWNFWFSFHSPLCTGRTISLQSSVFERYGSGWSPPRASSHFLQNFEYLGFSSPHLMHFKRGNQIYDSPFSLWVSVKQKMSLLSFYVALGAHCWTGRFAGFLCLIMATLAGIMKSIFGWRCFSFGAGFMTL